MKVGYAKIFIKVTMKMTFLSKTPRNKKMFFTLCGDMSQLNALQATCIQAAVYLKKAFVDINS
jgi:hypothetical protein